jgi:hypothetical protein
LNNKKIINNQIELNQLINQTNTFKNIYKPGDIVVSPSSFDRDKNKISGKYLFTLDWHNPDSNRLDDGYSETPDEHKCGHVIERDDGNFAIQPNNRIFVFEPSYTTKYGDPLIHRIINDRKWDVEDKKKWVTEDSNAFHYDIETKKENE